MEEESRKDHRALFNPGEENELEVFGYQTQNLRRALCLITSMLTCGVLLLLFYWKPQWRVWANCIPCSLQEAETIFLRTMVRAPLCCIYCTACDGQHSRDEFQRYMRKKVICLYLATLKFPVSKNPEEPLVTDYHSFINQAILKPELKVSEFKSTMLLEDSNTCYDIHHTFGLGLTGGEQEVRLGLWYSWSKLCQQKWRYHIAYDQ
ncbi:hypothetical protein J1605_008290 [Eschrichtius robustus]|uniref:Cation-transporting ATPase n=1 Tax=Eschrichtius robustus TaxID=9764 RepID=A0AB34H0C4_ESCRO|nr:hypothetical protein J1605_008290 [Eschrichtius robustus]